MSEPVCTCGAREEVWMGMQHDPSCPVVKDAVAKRLSLGAMPTSVPAGGSGELRSNRVMLGVGMQPTGIELSGDSRVRVARVVHEPTKRSYTLSPGSPGPGETARLVDGPALYGGESLVIDLVNETDATVQAKGVVIGYAVPHRDRG